jgi:hypothetical protein
VPIDYALVENPLTADPDDYNAVVQFTRTADVEELIQRVLQQGSTLNEGVLRAAAVELAQATKSLLLEGARVQFFDLAHFYPRVKGVFVSGADGFDPARHRVDVAVTAAAWLRNEVRQQAVVRLVEAIKPAPSLSRFHDNGSATADDQLTPGNIAELRGSRLKFDPTRPDEGVFFIHADGGDTQVPVSAVQTHKPSKLLFLIPTTLAPGTYHVEVRARMATPPKGPDTRALRIGRLEATLTV